MELDAKYYLTNFPVAELLFDDGARFKFCSYAYKYPEGSDFADWHQNYILFTAPGFKSEFIETCMEGHILKMFLSDIAEFCDLKRPSAKLVPREPFFSLIFSFDEQKKVIVKGSLWYPLKGDYPNGIGYSLEFENKTSLNAVSAFSEGIKAILRRFPPR